MTREKRMANAILREEEKEKKSQEQRSAQIHLHALLEKEIAVDVEDLIEQINTYETTEQETTLLQATLLLCYIKRKCNLFFRQRDVAPVTSTELAIYLEELGELAAYGGLQVVWMATEEVPLVGYDVARLYGGYYYIVAWEIGRAHV